MEERLQKGVVNFAPGPAQIPLEVLEESQKGIFSYQGTGIGVMEMSHRSPEYAALNQETMDLLTELLEIPTSHTVLLLQGGGTAQFAAIPLNLTQSEDDVADYLVTGIWSDKAAKEAAKYLKVNRALPKADGYVGAPKRDQWTLSPNAKYAYYCENETVHGVELSDIPDVGDTPLICDVSSNFLTKPLDIGKFGLLYAGAQKNVGCAGVTIVIVRKDLLGKPRTICPTFLNFTVQEGMKSVYNTPTVWAVYILNLVLKWIRRSGGVKAMEKQSATKSQLIFDVITKSHGFYSLPVREAFRSRVNVPFRVCTESGPCLELEAQFLKEAADAGLMHLKGHRAVGGLRVSLYNAVSQGQTQRLADFMTQFMKANAPNNKH